MNQTPGTDAVEAIVENGTPAVDLTADVRTRIAIAVAMGTRGFHVEPGIIPTAQACMPTVQACVPQIDACNLAFEEYGLTHQEFITACARAVQAGELTSFPFQGYGDILLALAVPMAVDKKTRRQIIKQDHYWFANSTRAVKREAPTLR